MEKGYEDENKLSRPTKVPKLQKQPDPQGKPEECPKPQGKTREDYVQVKPPCLRPPMPYCGPPPPTEKGVKEYKAQTDGLSRKALSFHNRNCKKSGGPLFELVKPLVSNPILFNFATASPIYFHINFEARPMNLPDAPLELFFAELLMLGSKVTVLRCCSLGAKGFDSAAFKDLCCSCPDVVIHPKDGEFMHEDDNFVNKWNIFREGYGL